MTAETNCQTIISCFVGAYMLLVLCHLQKTLNWWGVT